MSDEKPTCGHIGVSDLGVVYNETNGHWVLTKTYEYLCPGPVIAASDE